MLLFRGLISVFMEVVLGVHPILGARSARSSIVSISHLPIPPPVWALLPEDDVDAHERHKPVIQMQDNIRLDDGARCVCGSLLRAGDETVLLDCVVHTLLAAQQMQLEVQPCRKCPQVLRCFIGPDGLRQGLFNLNNTVPFTHDLLNDYTASFTSSETPFLAWTSTMRKRYDRHGSPLPFAHEATFRNAWFSYSVLQKLDWDMKCPKCGPAPENVIWDGVSLSFHRKHLLPSLRPPTMVHENSLICESRYHVQMPIRNPNLRRMMCKIILVITRSPARTSTTVTPTDGRLDSIAAEKAIQDPTSNLIKLVFAAHESLKLVDQALASCFYSRISLPALNSGMSRCKAYINLFLQVCIYTSTIRKWGSNVLIDSIRRLRPAIGDQIGTRRPRVLYKTSNKGKLFGTGDHPSPLFRTPP